MDIKANEIGHNQLLEFQTQMNHVEEDSDGKSSAVRLRPGSSPSLLLAKLCASL